MLKQLRNRFRILSNLQAFGNLRGTKRGGGRSSRPHRLARIEQLESRELLVADVAAQFAPTLQAEGEAATAPTMQIGTNLEAVYDWSPAWLFTDIFKHSRDWIPHERNTVTNAFLWQGDSTVHLDDHGWPTQLEQWENEDGELVVQSLGTLMYRETGGNYPGGLYRAEWDGVGSVATGAIEFEGDAMVIAHGQTPAGRNFADLQVTPSNEGIYMAIHEIADPLQPIENINVWMPDYQGQSFVGQRDWSPGADFSPFHPLFVQQLSSFNTLRFMQISGALESDAVDWSERRELNDARQIVTDRVADGMAPEYMAELARQAGSNAWLNTPHTADDDYVRNLATIVRDTLAPDQTIYVEWSNEAWNADYDVYHWVTGQIDSDHDRWDIMAREIRRDFDIWTEVFEGQEDRLVRVVGAFNHTPQVAVELLARMNGEFDALASATYVAPDPEERATYVAAVTTTEDVLQHTLDSTATTLGFLNEHKTLLESYEQSLGRDLGFILYEGGPHLDVINTTAPEAFAQAFVSVEMYAIEELLLNGTRDLGVDLFTDFQFTERLNNGVGFNATLGGNFGSLQYQDQPIEDAHKFRALTDAINGDMFNLNNQRPTISGIADYMIEEGETLEISFTIDDTETPADSLILITDASESDLVPNSAISVVGSGTNRTLIVTPQPSSMSLSFITILVTDSAGGTALESFWLEVLPADPPELNTPPNASDASFATLEDEEAWIPLWQIADDAETPFEQLDFVFTNVAGGSVVQYDAWSAIFTPHANFDGTGSFDYTVIDDGAPSLSSTAAITIDVTPVNDNPTAANLSLVTNEDTPVEFSLASVIGDIETPVEQLNVVFPQVWGGTLESTGQTHGYRFAPEANDFGTVQLWFQVFDAEGLDEWGSVTIDVLAVNDAPVAQTESLATSEGVPLWISLVDMAADVETSFEHLVFTFNNVIGGTVSQIDPYTAVFTPFENFVGDAGFNYTVQDAGIPPLSSTADVAIAISSLEELNGNSLGPELESTLDSIAAHLATA